MGAEEQAWEVGKKKVWVGGSFLKRTPSVAGSPLPSSCWRGTNRDLDVWPATKNSSSHCGHLIKTPQITVISGVRTMKLTSPIFVLASGQKTLMCVLSVGRVFFFFPLSFMLAQFVCSKWPQRAQGKTVETGSGRRSRLGGTVITSCCD